MVNTSEGHAKTRDTAGTDLRLHRYVLWPARVLWLAIVFFELVYMVDNLIALFPIYHTACKSADETHCASYQLTVKQLLALSHYGFSLNGYAAYAFICLLIPTFLNLSVGFMLFWFRSDRLIGLFVSLWLITGAVTVDAAPGAINNVLTSLIWPAMFLIFAMVPNGRFVPRWGWFFPVLYISIRLLPLLENILPHSLSFVMLFLEWLKNAGDLFGVVCLAGILGTQIYRYRVVASAQERQQIKWFVSGFALIILLPLSLLPAIIPDLNRADSWFQLATPAIWTLQFLFLPVGMGIALFRYRLWGVDVIINRALVYGLLTLILALVYLGSVLGGQALLTGFIGHNEGIVIVASTLIVAVLFQPLRHRIQNVIDRRFYLRKYDAAKTVEAFSATLSHEIDVQQLSEHLVAVVQETMQPAHVSLWLYSPARSEPQEGL